MNTPAHVVIVGGGLGGAKTAQALRDEGFTGTVTLLAAESDLPYERPPLSKDYLAGNSSFDDALAHPEQWYAEHDIDLRLSTRATSLDAQDHHVGLSDGTSIGYDKLVLATGSTPRTLHLPGTEARGVHDLRTREDSETIHATFGTGRRLIVIGGGWIGLEVAAAARGAGTDVTLIEVQRLPLLGVLGGETAQVFADLHRDSGVELHLGAQVEQVLTDGEVCGGVQLDGGRPSRPTRSWSASVSPRTWTSPKPRAWPPMTGCSSMRACAPVTRTSMPSETSPTTTIPCWACGCGWSTGPPR